jgi:hypothetical protein
LLAENKNVSKTSLQRFVEMANKDRSALVRLYLAAAMQRLAPARRWEVLTALVRHPEDSEDHNIPLMLWYASEPLATLDADRLLRMAELAKDPHFFSFAMRRVATLKSKSSNNALKALKKRLNNEVTGQQQLLDSLLAK